MRYFWIQSYRTSVQIRYIRAVLARALLSSTFAALLSRIASSITRKTFSNRTRSIEILLNRDMYESSIIEGGLLKRPNSRKQRT